MATRAPARPTFRCGECAAESVKWQGRCPGCQAWSSLVEVSAPTRASGLKAGLTATAVTTPARPVGRVDLAAARHVPTGIGELDRVLGGGLVPGSVVLLAGEPGVGKSTLLLEVAAASARAGRRSLVVTGEESTAQVRLRAERTGALHDDLWLAAETDLGAVLGHLDAVAPALLIVDSVQTISSGAVEGSAGGVTQVREVAAALTRVAKERGIATVLVGHVTKDGGLAGPRVLEHLVDVVLHAEGERHSTLRMVRAVKNRYGAADEVGCFEQTDTGLVEVPDPSGLFLSRRDPAADGTCVTVAVEGRRCLVTEVQALTATKPAEAVPARRGVSGLDPQRVGMLLAVLSRHGGPALAGVSSHDVFAATVGGSRVTEPAADLAVCLAIAGAHTLGAFSSRLVAIGEVGLTGELRRVPGLGRRLAEAARLGFTTALVPPDPGPAPPGLTLVEVPDLARAMTAAGRSAPRGAAQAGRGGF